MPLEALTTAHTRPLYSSPSPPPKTPPPPPPPPLRSSPRHHASQRSKTAYDPVLYFSHSPPLQPPPQKASPGIVRHAALSPSRLLSRRSSRRHKTSDDEPVELRIPRARRPSSSTAPSLSMSSQPGHSEEPSDLSGNDDEEYHNNTSQQFPPLLPTARNRTSVSRNRKSVTAKIRDQVARYESQVSALHAPSDTSLPASEHYSSEDEAQRLWVLLKQKRQLLGDSRSQMARRRKQLRSLRRQKDEADNTFMGLLRPLLAKGQLSSLSGSQELLQVCFNDMQTLRTEYHSTESAYEGLEVALDEQEGEINRLEIRFFTLLAERTSQGSDARESQKPAKGGDASGTPYVLLGISPDGPPERVHPLWHELLDAVGEMNIAQEELDDVQLSREVLEYELGVKERTNRSISYDDLELLREFPADEKAKRQRVQEMTEQVHQLRDRCMAMGVDQKDPPSHVAYALGLEPSEEITLDEPLPGTEQTLAQDRYPGLLSQPDHLLRSEPLSAVANLKQAARLPAEDVTKESRMRSALKEYDISELLRNAGETDKTDFITRWLLQTLRTSPHQVDLLANTFTQSTRLKIVDARRWELDVLLQWWKDDAAVQSVDDVGQQAFTIGTTRSSSDPTQRLRIRGSSRSSRIMGLASEPPDDHPGSNDIWERQGAVSRQLGSETASDDIFIRFWDERFGGKPA